MSISLPGFDGRSLLSSVTPLSVIQIEYPRIPFEPMVVMGKEIDESIPALLVQLWKFEGGYDHANFNIIEVDFGINKMVEVLPIARTKASIEKIASYREPISGISEKEEFYFDMWPDKTAEEYNEGWLPYQVSVELSSGEKKSCILPSWTPLQQVPLQLVRPGSILEIWQIKEICSIMRVISH